MEINFDEVKRLDTLKSFVYLKLNWVKCQKLNNMSRQEILFILQNPNNFKRSDRYCNRCGVKKNISEFKNDQNGGKMRSCQLCASRNKKVNTDFNSLEENRYDEVVINIIEPESNSEPVQATPYIQENVIVSEHSLSENIQKFENIVKSNFNEFKLTSNLENLDENSFIDQFSSFLKNKIANIPICPVAPKIKEPTKSSELKFHIATDPMIIKFVI